MPFTPSPTFFLQSLRLYISHLQPTDLSHCTFIVDLYNSDNFIAENGKTSVVDPEKAKDHLEGWIASNFEKNGYGCYLISLRWARDQLNGGGKEEKDEELSPGTVPVGIVTLMRGHYTIPDVGFGLLPAYTSRGYATEAGHRIIEYATTPVQNGGLGLNGVFGFTSSTNEKSKKVCERLGLKYRGVYPLEAFEGQESAVYVSDGVGELKDCGIHVERVDG